MPSEAHVRVLEVLIAVGLWMTGIGCSLVVAAIAIDLALE